MQNLKKALELTKVSRKTFLNILDNYTLSQLNKVPEGFKNNLFWNIAHVVVTQQLLCYKLSGLEMIVNEDWVNSYKKGTYTINEASEEDLKMLKELLFSSVEKAEADINNAVFKEFTEYPTSTGFVITSIIDAFEFNNFHEAIHLGYILALKKAV